MSVLSNAVLLLQAKNYSGSGDWLDESGNSYDATLVNAPTHNGTHFILDGVDQHFDIPDPASGDLDFALADDFTVMFVGRVSDNTPAADMAFVTKYARDGGAAWWLEWDAAPSNSFRASIRDGTNQTQSSNTSVPANDTVFVATMVRNTTDDDLGMFIDGTENTPVTDNTTGSLANDKVVSIGAFGDNALFFAGDVFAVAVWRQALTDSEIVDAGNALLGGGDLMLLGVGR